jgi:RNA polymerase sigma factor (sigma-70 family)
MTKQIEGFVPPLVQFFHSLLFCNHPLNNVKLRSQCFEHPLQPKPSKSHFMKDSRSAPEEIPGRSRDAAPITDWVTRFDDESVRELMEHYRPLLYEIARRQLDRRIGRRIDPSDALQLTWSSIAESSRRTEFKNRTHFAGFLTKTLGNHLVNIRRSVYADKRSVAREVDCSDTATSHLAEAVRPEQDVLDRMIQREFLSEVLAAILHQPREIQRLLRWRYRKGMTYAAIAERIDRDEDDVRRLVHKCVNSLCRDMQLKHGIRR